MPPIKSPDRKFPNTVRVGTNNLPAGTYTIHWQAGSSDVKSRLPAMDTRLPFPQPSPPPPGLTRFSNIETAVARWSMVSP